MAVLCGLSAGAAGKDSAEVTLNLKDADIGTLISTVSEVTGKNFVVDPRVKGKVTVISSSPMDAAGVYETFLAVLQVNGFAAVPSGESVKIIPEPNARTEGGGYVDREHGLAMDEIVTRVFDIHNGSATQLQAVLRQLVAQNGALVAYPPSNSLIVSDRASNIARLARLIGQMDQAGDRGVELVHLDNASADDVVRTLTQLSQQGRQADPGAPQPAIIADARSNSVLLAAGHDDRDKLIALIRQLDSPSKDSGDTQVIYLHYADAQNLAPILEGYAQQVSKPASTKSSSSMFGSSGGGSSSSMFGNPGSSAAQSSSASSSSSSSAPSSYLGGGGSGDIRVLADKDTNSLVITAPPKTMQKLRGVIERLDIRRAQVLVEAIIAEISADKTRDLGLDWIAFNPKNVAAASIVNPSTQSLLSSLSGTTTTTTGTSKSSLLTTAAAGLAGTGGLNALLGTASNGSVYGAVLHALQSDVDTNILSTPSLVTLDNEEAKIEVGQQVPMLTGSFANTGTASNGAVNPFQTIDREDVGLKLGITPTIGEGNTIRMKIEFENSTISSGTAGSSNLVTNKRAVSNVVSMEGGQLLVIGGLIDDQVNDTQSRVPLLGDIPFIGALFKAKSLSRTKRNLMIFVHPVILRERDEGDFQTRRKYDETRQAEIRASGGDVPGGQRPVLFDYDEYMSRSARPAVPPPPPGEAPGGAPPSLPAL
ncbi:MAG: type II secretion system secretin GspD, partial [Nevskia sp.]|nr:type II secretion system secretin GspD [Nevskia sp.]